MYISNSHLNEESAAVITQAAAELQKHTAHSTSKSILNYINAGIIYADKGSDETVEYDFSKFCLIL